MKKITFAVAACAMFAFAACSNSAETAGTDTLQKDSSVEPAAEVTSTIDTLKNIKGQDSAYVFKGVKADGTDSVVLAEVK